ncbi:MAG: isoprenylcysteine carboxylmethyltransferase family protein [Chloroflexi bacterium]|nr:isoprenylcysteine carboxylmethyltransferase family protein [Chloroflexota bacterium]
MLPENLFRGAIVALLLAAFTISGIHRRRADAAGGDKIDFSGEGRFIRAYRVTAALAFYFALFSWLSAPGWYRWAILPLPPGLRLAGLILAWAALPGLVWMFRSLGANITPTVVTRAAHQLVTHGPYRYIRHPLYTFAGAMYAGIGLASANALLLALMPLGFYSLVLRTPLEEAELERRFGDVYRAYKARTGRFLPRLRRES